MSLTADPPACAIAAAGGKSTHKLANAGAERLAFKCKTSNNNDYRLKPVFGFVEPGGAADLEITRNAGAPKEDKLVVLCRRAGRCCRRHGRLQRPHARRIHHHPALGGLRQMNDKQFQCSVVDWGGVSWGG